MAVQVKLSACDGSSGEQTSSALGSIVSDGATNESNDAEQ